MREYINLLKIENIAIFVTLLGTFLSVVGFFFGHFLAAIYFTTFDIPYFVYTDFSTPFIFFLRSLGFVLEFIMLFVLYFSLSYFILLLIAFYSEFNFYTLMDDLKSKGFYLGFYKPIPSKIGLSFSASMFAILVASVTYSNVSLRNMESFNYEPYNIYLDDKEKSYLCVYPLGVIGDYFAFMYKNTQPILVRKSSILSIELAMSEPPILKVGNGQINNLYYDQKEEWLTYWNKICSDDKFSNFKRFNFPISKNTKDIKNKN